MAVANLAGDLTARLANNALDDGQVCFAEDGAPSEAGLQLAARLVQDGQRIDVRALARENPFPAQTHIQVPVKFRRIADGW